MTDRTRYHFACVDVAADAIDIFIREDEKFADTIWRQQKTDGLLLESKVFRELYSIQEQDDLPPWPFLVMTRFTGDDVPALALPHTGIVRRADVNKPVANAYFPNPAPDNLAGPADVKYKIEYIDVFDAHIGDYHSVIENYDSIAKKRLVAEKWMHNFIPTSTVETLMADPGIPSWNVLHVLGFDDPESINAFRAKRRHIITDLVPGMMID